jgi:hypothetical protein
LAKGYPPDSWQQRWSKPAEIDGPVVALSLLNPEWADCVPAADDAERDSQGGRKGGSAKPSQVNLKAR